MPIYEYVCQDCGTRTEALRKMDEADAPLACGKCGSEKTRRAHSVFAACGSDNGGDMAMPACEGCAYDDPNGPCRL